MVLLEADDDALCVAKALFGIIFLFANFGVCCLDGNEVRNPNDPLTLVESSDNIIVATTQPSINFAVVLLVPPPNSLRLLLHRPCNDDEIIPSDTNGHLCFLVCIMFDSPGDYQQDRLMAYDEKIGSDTMRRLIPMVVLPKIS